ncbi:LOW QUALITY PROTEIN: uncharacterized protein LOC109405403 [Aedes albopictus]|uniref:RING-type E3 ubiquitin transferase n=1 Tax=Aedes albopictus TaxID=7160 RepID=A0ABM1ZLQ8_AEDAL
MANLPPLPKVASTGSSDPQPRPESYNNRPCTGRGCSSVNSSSLSRASARLALRLRQINEERAIQQREIEMERRAFAFERKVLNEKYRLLEQQIQRKSTFKEPSADGIQLSTSPHTADNSTIPKKLKIPSIQSIGIESLTDRLKSLGTQQRISSAFPKADSMTQNMSASSSVRCNMENFIARAPYGTPSNSEFNYEDTAVRSHQPCHGTVQHQRQVCISSQGSSCVRKFSQNTRRNSITNTKDLRTTRKIKPIFCQGQQRIVIKLPLLQLHQYVKSHMECSIVCVQKELTVIERAQNDYRSALSETRVCRIPSYLDTGQKLKNRTQSRMKNVETKSSLFSTKKTDLLIAVMHGSSMLCTVPTTPEQNKSSSSSLLSLSSTLESPASRKKEICKFFKMGIYRYGSVCSNTHVAPATEQTQSGLSFAADSGPSFTIDPLKRINASEFVFKFNQWQSPTGSVEVQQTEQMLPEERLVSLDLSEEGVVADDEAEEEDAIAAAGMPYAVVITISVGMIGIHVDSVLCPYFESRGVCMMDTCPYVAIYKRCDKFCLNALDKEHQGLHDVECIKQHELDMQQSFTIHRSKDKICDIYLKVVMEKLCREQRFGILPNFSNIFYLKCIWTLRQAKHSKNNIKLGCRTCRIPSHFVCLSIVWVGSREEKDEPINDNMMACNITHCKHFKQDSSKCLFGNKCFYVLVDVGGPSRQTDNRLQISHLQEFFRNVLYQRELLIDFVLSILSDSDDSAMSEL